MTNAFTPRHRERRDFTAWPRATPVNIGLIFHSVDDTTAAMPSPIPSPAPAPPTLLTHRASSQILFAFAPRRRERRYYSPSRHDASKKGRRSKAGGKSHNSATSGGEAGTASQDGRR